MMAEHELSEREKPEDPMRTVCVREAFELDERTFDVDQVVELRESQIHGLFIIGKVTIR
jgi:hypothetical protein